MTSSFFDISTPSPFSSEVLHQHDHDDEHDNDEDGNTSHHHHQSKKSIPSLTSCLRLILDEEVLQILPHRIVAIRNAKRKKRALINQATAANVGIGEKTPEQVLFGGGGGTTASASTADALFGYAHHHHNLSPLEEKIRLQQSKATSAETLIFISEDDANAAREEAQTEMRNLVLDRTEFVAALTELLVERELLRDTIIRESVARYSSSSSSSISSSNKFGGKNGRNGSPLLLLSPSSSARSSRSAAASFDQIRMMESGKNNNNNSPAKTPSRPKSSSATMGGGRRQSVSAKINNNLQSLEEELEATAERARKQQTNTSGYFTETEAQHLVSRVWIYDKFKQLLFQQARESFGRGGLLSGTSNNSNTNNNNTTTDENINSNNKKNDQPSDGSTRKKSTTVQFALDGSIKNSSKQASSIKSTDEQKKNNTNNSNQQRQQQQPLRAKRLTSLTGKSEQRTFMNFWRICPYQSRMMTRIVFNMPRHQLHPDDALLLEEINNDPQYKNQQLAKLFSSSASLNNHKHAVKSPEESLSASLSFNNMQENINNKNNNGNDDEGEIGSILGLEADDKDAFLLGGLANVDIWMRKHDHDTPFPAAFLESMPRVRELRSKIEPLVDYVFSAADIDHTNSITFRYITELILEREGRLSAIPFRPNLNSGMELVLDNGADGTKDLLIPRGTNHICSIEGSPHLMLVSNAEGSKLVNGVTGQFILKLKQPNLRKPRILEMSLKEICYALLSERAREAQMEQDKIMHRQERELQLRRARSSAEQMAMSAVGPTGNSVFLGGTHNPEGQARAARAMHATSLTADGANRKNDHFTSKTFRDSNYLVCSDGSMGLYFYYFDEKQMPSIFSKSPDAYLKLPILPSAYACAGGYVFVGDSVGNVRILDATSVLLNVPYESCLCGHYKGNHHFVQTFKSQKLHMVKDDANAFYCGDEYQGAIPSTIKAAFTTQNFRPENFQLGHASVTSIETLFHHGHNRFAFTLLDGTLNVVDIPTMSLYWCQEAHQGGATLIKRIWGTDTYVSLGFDQTPKIWQGLGGLAVQHLRLMDSRQPHTTRISSIELGLERIMQTDVTSTISSRDINDNSTRMRPLKKRERIVATRLFTAGLDGLIKTWDLSTNMCTHSLYTVDLKDSSRTRSAKEHFSAATIQAIANYQEAAPIQQGCYISAAGRFLFIGYRSRGLVRLSPAENTVRAHFGPALSLACPISGRMISVAGNGVRMWNLFPGGSSLSSIGSDYDYEHSPLSNVFTSTSTNSLYSPLQVDVVSPFVLGYAVGLCVNLEEERVFVATSSGCIVVLRVETGRVLKVFFPHGKGAVAAEATVITAHEKTGELTASEDVAAFSSQDPSGEIVGICYSYGSRELVVHYAQDNTLNIFSDVGKQRLPVRMINLRTSFDLIQLGNKATMALLASVTDTNANNNSSNNTNSPSRNSKNNNHNSNNQLVVHGNKHNNNQKQLEFRALPQLWNHFTHTGSPSIISQMPDLNLGIYSLDSETGVEQQRLLCCVEIPVEGFKYDKYGIPILEQDKYPEIAMMKKEQQQQESFASATSPLNNSNKLMFSSSSAGLLSNNNNNNNSSSSSPTTGEKFNEQVSTMLSKNFGAGGLFKDIHAKKEIVYKSRNYLPTANCTCFLGDYSFVAVGCAMDNAILFYPSRSGVHGRSENGLESRVTDFTPSEPAPCGVIFHVSEPHFMTFAPVRQLLYVADQKCRVVVYSLTKWLRAFHAKTTLQLIDASVHAPGNPRVVVPSSFHEIPRWALILDRKQQEEARMKKKLKKERNNNSNNTLLGGGAGGGTSDGNFFLTQEEESTKTGQNDHDDSDDDDSKLLTIAKKKEEEDMQKFHKLAIRAFEYTERLLKDKSAPPLVVPAPSNNNDRKSSVVLDPSTIATRRPSSTSENNSSELLLMLDPLYEEWQKCQPTIVSVIPDAFHYAEGSIQPKDETEPPWKKYQTITTISVMDRNILDGAAIAIAYGSGIVLLFNEFLDRCIGELRADVKSRFSFTPFLSTLLMNDPHFAKHQQQQGNNNNHHHRNNNNMILDIFRKPSLRLPVFEEVEYHNPMLRMFVLSHLQSAISLGGSVHHPEKDETVKVIAALLALPRYASPDDIDRVLTALTAQQQSLNHDDDDDEIDSPVNHHQNKIGAIISPSSSSFVSRESSNVLQDPFDNASFGRHARNFLLSAATSASSSASLRNGDDKNHNNNSSPCYVPAPTATTTAVSSSSSVAATNFNFKGMSLWLSMAQKMGGNEEKRWYRFVQWRRLEEWHRQIEAVRREIPGAQFARQRVLEEEERAELKKQSLMTVTERRMYLKEKSVREKREDGLNEKIPIEQRKSAAEIATSSANKNFVPLEYLVLNEMLEEGKRRAFRLIGNKNVMRTSALGMYMVDERKQESIFKITSTEQVKKLDDDELRRRKIREQQQQSVAPTVPTEVMEYTKNKRKSVVFSGSVNVGPLVVPVNSNTKSSVTEDANMATNPIVRRKQSIVTILGTDNNNQNSPATATTKVQQEISTNNNESSNSNDGNTPAFVIPKPPSFSSPSINSSSSGRKQATALGVMRKTLTNNNNNEQQVSPMLIEVHPNESENEKPILVTSDDDDDNIFDFAQSISSMNNIKEQNPLQHANSSIRSSDENDGDPKNSQQQQQQQQQHQPPPLDRKRQQENEKSQKNNGNDDDEDNALFSNDEGASTANPLNARSNNKLASAASFSSSSFYGTLKRVKSATASILGNRKLTFAEKEKEKELQQQHHHQQQIMMQEQSSSSFQPSPSTLHLYHQQQESSAPLLMMNTSGVAFLTKEHSGLGNGSTSNHQNLFSSGIANFSQSGALTNQQQQQFASFGFASSTILGGAMAASSTNHPSSSSTFNATAPATSSNLADFLFAKQQEESAMNRRKNAIRGLLVTKQIKPVLAARGVGAERMKHFANCAQDAIGAEAKQRNAGLLKVTRQHKNSVREVVEDQVQEDVPHTFALNLILEHNVD